MRFQIKSVARMTGIPRNTLLVWERRYAIVTPTRAENGYRLYSQADVDRLRSVRVLTQKGYKVTEAIAMVEDGTEPDIAEVADAAAPLKIAVLSESLSGVLGTLDEAHHQVQSVTLVESVDALMSPKDSGIWSALLVDIQDLGSDPGATIRKWGTLSLGCPVVVVYQFASRRVLSALTGSGAVLIRRTADSVEFSARLVETIRATETQSVLPIETEAVASQDFALPTERRFTDRQLVALGQQKFDIACECPRHLAEIVTSLVAFEDYSRHCLSRSEKDRVLHERLEQGTAHVRRLMEAMLSEVVTEEGIVLVG